jgi:hypothetical protein
VINVQRPTYLPAIMGGNRSTGAVSCRRNPCSE